MVLLLGTSIWALTYALHWTESTAEGQKFWLNMTYLGVLSTPTALFVFTIQFLGRPDWMRKHWVFIFLIEPVITFILLWTDPYHDLFFGGLSYPHQHNIYDGGIWFWINVTYSYVLIFISLILIARAVYQRQGLYKKQAVMILIGMAIPIIGNIITFLGINPFNGLDIPPIFFTFTGLFIAFAIVNYRLFDLIPIGRDTLVEHLQEGMLLVDGEHHLVDINPAAKQLFRLGDAPLLGKSIESVLKAYPQLFPLFSEQTNQTIELSLSQHATKFIEVKTEIVKEPVTGTLGTLLICRDITTQKVNEISLREQYEEITALQASLSEQAIRDPLTGLYNRRFLHETLSREISIAKRNQESICVAMLDLDYFKQLNDTFGHPAGDEVLIQMGLHLQNNTRASDVVVRFGGEEFLIVLLNTRVDIAVQKLENWREEFSTKIIEFEQVKMNCSFSAGISVFPDHSEKAEELINLADIALYQAKAAGRNCTVVYSPVKS